VLEGTATKGQRAQAAVGVAPVERFEAPAGLTAAERAVWNELAEHAFEARTLVPATAYAFVLLIRNVVLERELRRGPDVAGSNHRGVLHRVESGLTAFGLRALGKPVVRDVEAAPVDPFAVFDEPIRPLRQPS
jgi:hypothetical protein